jgi:hypothetical protein
MALPMREDSQLGKNSVFLFFYSPCTSGPSADAQRKREGEGDRESSPRKGRDLRGQEPLLFEAELERQGLGRVVALLTEAGERGLVGLE